MADVTVVDYGMGNLASVRRAFENGGASVEIATTADALALAERIVLPGVGAFPDAMAHLRRNDWEPALHQAVADGTPLLGICLGMQLLMDSSTEGSLTRGLGLIAGEVRRFSPSGAERVPHVGWNEVHVTRPSTLTGGIEERADFYFVHSYHVEAARGEDVLATTPYITDFTAIIGRDNVHGAQFHPEKSGRHGARLLENFLAS